MWHYLDDLKNYPDAVPANAAQQDKQAEQLTNALTALVPYYLCSTYLTSCYYDHPKWMKYLEQEG